jgi:hypothetical protein
MKKLKYLKTFEAFQEDPKASIDASLGEIKKILEKMFKTGSFSKERGLTLEKIEILSDSLEPYVNFEFSTNDNFFEFVFKLDYTQALEEEKDVLVQYKKYNQNDIKVIFDKQQKIKYEELTEDYLIKLISDSLEEEI